MKTLQRLTREITGKDLAFVNTEGWFYQDVGHIEIPRGRGKKEAVIHEVCHWVIAEPWQRIHPNNLGYGSSSDDYRGKDPRCTSAMLERQERLCCHLQRLLYQFAGLPVASSPSCRGKRMTRPLTAEEVEDLVRRTEAVGWGDLIDLARAQR